MSSSRRRRHTLTAGQFIVFSLAFLLLSTAGGVLVAGLALPLVGTAGTVVTAGASLFDEIPTELNIAEPSSQSVLYAADGSKLATFYVDNRIIVSSDQIAQTMKDAVVSIEDERFYQHTGIDPEGMMRALVTNIFSGHLSGGSTLTQQYVKNVLIDQGASEGDDDAIEAARERSLGRKLREARYALALERQVPKDDILVGYLNIASFGPGQYGVEAASRHYFNKHAKDLTVVEAATLAGITQAPARWDPVRNPEDSEKRRNTVLYKMHELGKIDDATYEQARNTPLKDTLNVTETPNGCGAAGINAYYCEYAIKDLLDNPEFGKTRDERVRKVYRGGLKIYTALDPQKQKLAHEAVINNLPIDDPSGIDMALTSVEPGTGKIVAMTQNTRWGTPTKEKPENTQVNLNVGVNRGGGIGFQSGSSFKPFTLIQWLRTGHSPYDTVNSSNRTFQPSEFTNSCKPDLRGSEPYKPRNIEGIGGGRMSVVESTRRSVNLSFVDMATKLDMCDITDIATKMGVRRGDGKPLMHNPSAVLGSNNVTPLSMATAFATLANDGIACDPMAITKVEDNTGNVIFEPKPSCRPVLDPEVNAQAVWTMQKVVTPQRGSTGARAVIPGRPVAGKTGTANRDTAAWFVGFTPQLSTAIWQGHIEGTVSMFNSTINGQFYREVFGGLFPAQTFHDYMSKALEGLPPEPFPAPKRLIKPRPVAPPRPQNPAPEEGSNSDDGGASDSDSNSDSGDDNDD